MKNAGTMDIYTQNGNVRSSNKVVWDVDYDGDKADIDLVLTRNGDAKHVRAQLDNDDIERLLEMPVVSTSLDDRLSQDYLVDKRVYKLSPVDPNHILMRRRAPTRKRRATPKTRRLRVKAPKKRKPSSVKVVKLAHRPSSKKSKKSSKSSKSRKTTSRNLKSFRTTPRPKTRRIHLTKRSSSSKSRSSRSKSRSKSS